jgi:hypothetical protein
MQFVDVLRNFVKLSVLDAERSGRPYKLDDKKLMDISDSMQRSPSKSMRKLAQEKISALQQRMARSEKDFEPLPIPSNSGARIETSGS